MTTRQTSAKAKGRREGNNAPERTTIPAKDVGVTLRISDEALKKLDQIQEETIKGAQSDQDFAWR